MWMVHLSEHAEGRNREGKTGTWVNDPDFRCIGIYEGTPADLNLDPDLRLREARGNLPGKQTHEAVKLQHPLDDSTASSTSGATGPASAGIGVVRLRNGLIMPRLGFGTGGLQTPVVAGTVDTALDLGYHLLDTASEYGNEAVLGAVMAKRSVDTLRRVKDARDRDELGIMVKDAAWVTTKVSCLAI